MNKIELRTENLRKNFVRNIDIFSNVNINYTNNEIIGLIGDNGSGKSTLMRIIAGVLSSSSGKVEFKVNDKVIERNDWNKHYSYVAPYVNLYEEFTPVEHYKIMADIKGIAFNEKKLDDELKYFKLYRHKHSQIKGFSSGMKQRFKFILAEQSEVDVLFLDEPTSNLDEDGINKVFEVIKKKVDNGGTVVIATNEERERVLCNRMYNIMDFKQAEKY